jgi:protein-S-isoprenylcysteine O-methyltransferase Ste14
MTRFLLPYYIIFFAIAFVWPSWRIWRRDGINPLVLPRDDSAYGLIGVEFKATMVSVLALTLAISTGSGGQYFGGLDWLEHSTLRALGSTLLIATLIWITIAQAHMGKSWRIGIDSARKTDLVETGIFARSRNPIFLGMRLNMLGLFFIAPNAVSLAILVATEILIAIQVRLEEDHLLFALGKPYQLYCARVRRWL